MVSPIIKVLDELFKDTKLQSERLKLAALLKDVAKEAETDVEVVDTVREICEYIVTAISAEGKEITVDECTEMLSDAVLRERSIFLFNVARQIRRKRRRRGSGPGPTII